MNIDEALTKFITQLKADGRSDHTISQYERHIRLFGEWLRAERGTDQVDGLDHEVFAVFLNGPTARLTRERVVKRPNTVNALRTSLRCLFAFAHAAGWIRTNPARLVRRALCSPGPPRAMSDDEVAALLSTLEMAKGMTARRDHALIHLMLASGIRLSSALALRTADVDLPRAQVVLRNTKGSRTDVVLLSTKIREHLARYLADRRTGLVFAGPHGRRLSRRHAARRFAMWIKAAGVTRGYSPHSTRHSFATHLYKQTGDILLVKDALHHRSVLSSLVYTRLDMGRLRRALG